MVSNWHYLYSESALCWKFKSFAMRITFVSHDFLGVTYYDTSQILIKCYGFFYRNVYTDIDLYVIFLCFNV